MSVTHEQLSNAVREIDSKIEDNNKELIKAAFETTKAVQELSKDVSLLVKELSHNNKNMERIEKNQMKQGESIACHDRELSRLNTCIAVVTAKQEGLISLSMKFLPAPLALIAAISSFMAYLKG